MINWRLENAVIYICTVGGILGLYWMSHSFHSLWLLVLLLFVNFPQKAVVSKFEF